MRRVVLVVAVGVVLAVWGWTHPASRPNGATLLAVAVLAGVLWLVFVAARWEIRHRAALDDRYRRQVKARLDECLPRERAAELWAENREGMKQ